MRWQAKAAILAALTRLPGGSRLYPRLQQVCGSDRLDVPVEYERKRRFLERMLGKGLELRERSFLEVGTGWHPFLPLLLRLLGAERVVTLDVNPWLTRDSLEETIAGIQGIVPDLASDFGVDRGAAGERLDRLAASAASGSSPAAALRGEQIEYLQPVDAGGTGLPAGSFDYVVSSNVLEHVPPAEIRRILAETRRLLRDGGVTAHHVDPGDHFSLDGQVTSVNFLKFSPRSWKAISSGLAYHNRLRCADYPKLLEESGFEVFYCDAELDPRALDALRSGAVRPDPSFRGYGERELAEALIDVFARLPGQAAVNAA